MIMYAKVYVEITNICNMNCSFCHGHHRLPRRMSCEEFAHILSQLKGQTNYIYYHLMGEPLTHPLLSTFLSMAKEEGFKSIITTNGTLLAKHGEELLSAGLHKVNISIHSFEKQDKEAQEAYLRDIAAFAEMASKAGVIVVLRLWNKGHDDGNNDIAISYLHAYFPNEWQEHSRGVCICDKLYLEWGERFEWPDMNAPLHGEQVFCYGLKDQFGILCDGSVVPCCLDSEGIITLGNIFEQDIRQILDSPRANAMVEGFRCRHATEELCFRCGYAQRFRK